MNRFRTKKKAKDAADAAGRPSTDADAHVPKLKSSMTFRRGKKEPEPKLELDLANALPSSDDFRTSLLMSGLSARFSMLREQDDPKSKIGKASDDSVLFPKRQSQHMNFGFQSSGLADIAEVSSIRSGGPRPPFLYGDRTNSYVSVDAGYGTDDGGSMMGRAKPGEGNNLFGGRQKIYKIPVGGNTSMKNLNGDGEFKMGGRALYGDDVSQSAFQKLREREREQERQRLEREQEERDQAAQALPRRSDSPPLSGYNRNRETSSTTSSGPSFTRSSTAATSVTSQSNGYSTPSTPAISTQSNMTASLDRSVTKTKRLYETGLDRDLHSQQHSAMNRLENLSRPRNTGARTPSPGLVSPIAYENPEVHGFGSERHDNRSASPPPTASKASGFDFGTKPSALAPQKTFVAPPLSPPMSEGDDQSNLLIQPNDRGKATALGAFAKPVQPYDEDKYAQRQLQMQLGRDGRETPHLRKHSPPRAFVPSSSARPRAESNSTYSSARSGSSSSAQSQFEARSRNFNPQSMKKDPAVAKELAIATATFSSSPNGSSLNLPAEVEATPSPDVQTSHQVEDNDSDDEEIPKPVNLMQDRWAQIRKNAAETEKLKQFASTPRQMQFANGHINSPQITIARPPESQHPAHRPSNQKLRVDYTEEPTHPSIPHTSHPTTNERFSGHFDPPADSPTLGPGLSGLVRQHLRSDSNESAMFGGPSPALSPSYPPNPSLNTNTVYSTTGNPWENETWDQPSYGQLNGTGHSPSLNLPHYNTQFASSSPTLSRKLDIPPSTDTESRQPSWERELELHHTRAGSSETQKERDDFASELATRRKRVQESMKSFTEADSRSPNPAYAMDWQKETNGTKSINMGILKTKISRESVIGRPAAGNQSKAMKMLGLGNSTISSSPTPNATKRFDDNLWKQEEEEMLRGVPKSPRAMPTTKSFRQARRDAQRDLEREVRMRHNKRVVADPGDSDGSVGVHTERQRQRRDRAPSEERFDPASERRAPSQESKSSGQNGVQSGSRPPSRNTRDRSGSDTSGRSKSQNGRYRDDLAKAMAEGHGSSSHGAYEDASARRGPTKSPAPHVINFQNSAGYGGASPALNGGPRSRSNSKSGYLDGQLQPIQTHIMDIGISPRPSPVTPFSVNSTPALVQPSPTVSGANTPLGQGFPAHTGIPNNRKRSVNKSEISEPTLLHKTSDIVTINLPPGASLSNGSPMSAPPLPPMDPRRRQTRTQTMFDAITGKNHINNTPPTPSLPSGGSYDELSTFSADEAEKKKPRQRLRKSSSEGGNLNARARQAFDNQPSPALPGVFPGKKSPPSTSVEGGMF